MPTLFVVLSIALLTMTLLPLSRNERWWIRALEFPRLQLAVFALAIVVVGGVLLDFSRVESWAAWLIGAACFFWHAWWIAPYSPLNKKEVEDATLIDSTRRIRLLSANVLGSNRHADKFLSLVKQHQPDIVLTLESNNWWQSQLDVLEDDFPYTLKCPLENLYGMHVYSKLRLEQPSIEFLVSKDVPSMHAVIRLRSGECIRVRFLHPAPPSPNEATDTSERDAELMLIARNLEEENIPTIVAGDLNDVAWSKTTRLFRKTSGLLDPRIGRGMFNTFHAGYWFVRWPLDHLFHGAEFALCSLKRLERFGSDHFALLSELQYEPDNSNGNTSDEVCTEADAREARRKTEQVDVDTDAVPTPGRASRKH